MYHSELGQLKYPSKHQFLQFKDQRTSN